MEELDCLGTVLLVKVRRLRVLSMVDGFMANCLVEVENRKGSGMMTGILEAGSTVVEHYQWPQTRYLQRY